MSERQPGSVPREGLQASRRRWGDLRLRVLSALVAAPLALACVWFGGRLFFALILACLAGVVWEWGQMCAWRPRPLLFGVGYGACAMLSLWLWRLSAGPWAIFFLFAVVWCSDIGAYAAGRAIGGPRLAPAISPGKTWSGAVGGLLAAVVGGGLVAGTWSVKDFIAALVLGLASQLGDLGESAAKRHYRVKDSGRLLPGHGGLLDRVDGLMAAAIVAGAFLAASLSMAAGPAGQL